MLATVGIPTLNGGPLLGDVLHAAGSQSLGGEIELLVVDSGSTDGSASLARSLGARVVEIPRDRFSHGGTRNLIVREARGEFVALLTQDSVPADGGWLERLLAPFETEDGLALAFGPYLPRPEASHMVRRELAEFFAGFSPEGRVRVDRLSPAERAAPLTPGPRTFFTSANGCLSRVAWEQVPFREAPYAEDQLLAVEMLRAGHAKAYVPEAAVVHSHDYGSLDLLRRFFDEWRGLREVYGHLESASPRRRIGTLAREVRADRSFLRAEGARGASLVGGTAQSLRFHAIRAAGSVLGSRADRLPERARRALSLEGRSSFEPSGAGLPSS